MSAPDAAHRPAIGAHRVVGNGRSALLLRADGSVVWWCAPEYDSPPLAWSLLDPAGGALSFPGLRPSSRSQHPAGATASTTLAGPGGRVEVLDALLPGGAEDLPAVEGDDPGLHLVRLVRGLDGPLDVVHVAALGGFDAPTPSWTATGPAARARAGTTELCVTGGRVALRDGAVHTALRAPRGEWTAVVVSAGDPVDPDPRALRDRVAEAERRHADWLAGSRPPRSHRQRALDAMAVLRACTSSASGAVVAALTTGLPEVPGGGRNYDYRYSWLRDASLAVSVAALLGKRDDADRYLAFARRVAGADLVPDRPVVDVRGDPVPDEHTVDGVAGWAGSQPIRVGNRAGDQVQHDALGMLVEAISVHLQTGGRLGRDNWAMVAAIADAMAEDADRLLPSHGIWEQVPEQLYLDGDIGRWLALDRAIWISRGWRPAAMARRRRWKAARDTIAARVSAVLDDHDLLPQILGEVGSDGRIAPDASSLMAVVFGLLPPEDPRTHRMLDATIAALDAEPFLYRFDPEGEGAFLPVSVWVVTALAQVGRVAEARHRLERMCSALPRLLAEEVDPVGGESLGNVPLVWTHAELARALYVLDAAELRARFGPVVLWAWRLGRYARLRWGS